MYNGITEEQIRQWYNEDVKDGLISYEKYKQDILGIINEKRKETKKETEEVLENNSLTLDEIIYKVCGNDKFDDKKSDRYEASKIKVFNRPQSNKVSSISKSVISILPRTTTKLYGSSISAETKKSFKDIQDRANNLSDEEVEIILNQYNPIFIQEKGIPKAFNNAIKSRINLYISKKVSIINEKIKENELKINYCEELIKALKSKLQSNIDLEFKDKLNETLGIAYNTASLSIKKLLTLQLESNKLQNNKMIHDYNKEIIALNKKLNCVGGLFSKNREYAPELWSKISGLSQKIEYSLDSKEVSEAYFARKQIYKENIKEKNNNMSLVDALNYANDPFIKEMIESTMDISSTAVMISNITSNLKNINTSDPEENLTISNIHTILDLSNKYSNGQITYADMLKGVKEIKTQTTAIYQSYLNNLIEYIGRCASLQTDIDYTELLTIFNNAAMNTKNSIELDKYINTLYKKSLDVLDIKSLESIKNTLIHPILVPDILTFGTNETNNKSNKRDSELKDIIESLKAMKEELTEEDIKEIESLLNK